MKQYTENQYDDDLTVGTDEYDDSYHTDIDDLFEFSTDGESPISRLKSLILSIDWEITDEVLMQFNQELLDLRGIWAGEKLNLIYVQALEKISKYIYHKKADSHPSAIKLLLTLYHNLEKIVSSVDLSEEQKKEILLKDVKKFENLKHQISQQSQEIVESESSVDPRPLAVTRDVVDADELLNLKAIVLGIDWEITNEDLNNLRHEVLRLEEKFANNKPRLILLQGIGTIGAYIKLKKSDAHADAFKVLHLFYESLEKITLTPMDLEEEKAILFPAVEVFNSFKTQLGTTISPEALSRKEEETDKDLEPAHSNTITPAFADIPEGEARGFQAEEEAQALGLDSPGNVGSQIDTFFTGGGFLSGEPSTHVGADNAEAEAVEEMIGEAEMFAGEGDAVVISIAKEVALQGVSVEEDDEEEPDAGVVGKSAVLAPALSFESEKSLELRPALFEDKIEPKDDLDSPSEEITDTELSLLFPDADESEEMGKRFSHMDREVALQGVKVETEADEDADEEALPMMGEDVAPALAENDEVSIYNAELLEKTIEKDNLREEIAGNLKGFFEENLESPLSTFPEMDGDGGDVAGLPAESENDEVETDSVVGSQSILESPRIDMGDSEEAERFGEAVLAPLADDDAIVLEAEELVTLVDDQVDSVLFTEMFDEITLIPEPERKVKDSPRSAFADSELDGQCREESTATDAQFDNSEPEILEGGGGEEEIVLEFDKELDSFLDPGEGVEEPDEDKLLLVVAESGREDMTALETDILSPALDAIADDEEVIFELVEEQDEQLLDGDSSENTVAGAEIDKESDVLGTLRTCVASLGIEMDTKGSGEIFQEINSLRQTWSAKPLEKTFLQLLSTVAQHIDRNRYESSDEAYSLLQSVCDALSGLHGDDQHHNQEILLVEVFKVLEWQQGMLVRQDTKKGKS